MTWIDLVIITLGAMGFLTLIGLGRKMEAKLDAALKLVASLTAPTPIPSMRGRDTPPPPEEKTVYHLTSEHDDKILGDSAE